MKRCVIAASIAGLLLFSGTAWANEQTKTDGAMNHNMTPEEHKNMNMDSTKMSGSDHNMSPDEHKNMNMGGTANTNGSSTEGTSAGGHSSHGSHGGNAEVVETPPNLAVLGTFGGIMLAFILYGALTKWLRKKERAHT